MSLSLTSLRFQITTIDWLNPQFSWRRFPLATPSSQTASCPLCGERPAAIQLFLQTHNLVLLLVIGSAAYRLCLVCFSFQTSSLIPPETLHHTAPWKTCHRLYRSIFLSSLCSSPLIFLPLLQPTACTISISHSDPRWKALCAVQPFSYRL